MTLSLADFVADFQANERPIGNVLAGDIITAQAVAATRFYAGYASISSHAELDPVPEISPLTEISLSEWAIIRPLFMLYIEREQALYQESSRGMGMEVWGRSSSEIAGDITQREADLPRLAFQSPPFRV